MRTERGEEADRQQGEERAKVRWVKGGSCSILFLLFGGSMA